LRVLGAFIEDVHMKNEDWIRERARRVAIITAENNEQHY
jgi:hypothetical protein